MRKVERSADSQILDAWGELVKVWGEISEVFGDLGVMMGRGWDMALGILSHAGWFDLLRLKKLVEKLPQFREIVQMLGRLDVAENSPSVAEKILMPIRRLEEERREVRTPHVPAEMRGVERSGEVSRMLPLEATMLGHNKLRFLWHARRAERGLLTYRVEGVESRKFGLKRKYFKILRSRSPGHKGGQSLQ